MWANEERPAELGSSEKPPFLIVRIDRKFGTGACSFFGIAVSPSYDRKNVALSSR